MAAYSKIDVAEAQLTVAIRLFFSDAHPIAVHTLACAAREILTTLGGKMGVQTVLHQVAAVGDLSFSEAVGQAHAHCGFIKHADRDPTGILEGFSDSDNDVLLHIAVLDFARVTGGMPVEAQVFQAWSYATRVRRVTDGGLNYQRLVRKCFRLFPGIRSASRADQKRMGQEKLRATEANPALQMDIKRAVDLPNAAASRRGRQTTSIT